MRYTTIAATCIVLLFCALFAGCTSPTQAEIKPVATTVATTVPVTTTTVAEVTTPFESVVALPPNLMVDLVLSKDRPTSQIHLLYNGGPGEIFVQTVRMKVTRSDGTVIDELMDGGNQPKRGDELIIQGTNTGDHCEVWVTTAGKVYKVIDQDLYSMQ
jgi:ABC-type Fe3+-hydroxamate transport system substrate-binding protein